MMPVPTPGQRMATAATAAIDVAIDEARSQAARPTSGLTDAPTLDAARTPEGRAGATPTPLLGPSGPLAERG